MRMWSKPVTYVSEHPLPLTPVYTPQRGEGASYKKELLSPSGGEDEGEEGNSLYSLE
jgi:hypothetical protein